MEPRLLRSAPEELAKKIEEAVNAAFDNFRRRLAESTEVPEFDLNEVANELRKSHEAFESGTQQTMAEAGRTAAAMSAAGLTVVDVPAVDFSDLIADLTDILQRVSHGSNAEEDGPTGVGEAPQGLARAVCAPGYRLESLWLDPRGVRGTVELERNVVAAVNAALADLAATTGARMAAGGTDPQEIRKRLDDLHEKSSARLRSYMEALGEVIESIRPKG
jgi:hypothetical protein